MKVLDLSPSTSHLTICAYFFKEWIGVLLNILYINNMVPQSLGAGECQGNGEEVSQFFGLDYWQHCSEFKSLISRNNV